ncbi:hypothetical protein A5784_03715 [Mycobacterium sp. 852013-50091_SCH5140682]|nr:hypothetical protein A5784_03715 [Mycobacterium sp. 852013-50091_SCH5140682]
MNHMSIKVMHHTGIVVSDLSASVSFYEELGFVAEADQPAELLGEVWVDGLVGLDGVAMRLIFMSLGGSRIELIQYLSPVGADSATLTTNDVGNPHIALAVDDVEREYRRLRERGVEFVSEPVSVSGGAFSGLVVVYGKDPDGNLFELLSDV